MRARSADVADQMAAFEIAKDTVFAEEKTTSPTWSLGSAGLKTAVLSASDTLCFRGVKSRVLWADIAFSILLSVFASERSKPMEFLRAGAKSSVPFIRADAI